MSQDLKNPSYFNRLLSALDNPAVVVFFIVSWPFLNFHASNLTEDLDISYFVLIYLISLFIFISLGLFVYVFFSRKSYLLYIVFLYLFFAYSALRTFAEDTVSFALLSGFLLIAGIYLAIVLNRSVPKTLRSAGFGIFASVVFVSAAMKTVLAYYHTGVSTEVLVREIRSDHTQHERFADKRDVFLFIFDGYGRSDQLKAVLGFDNGEFLADLKKQGFTVSEDSYSAFPNTAYGVTSILDGDVFDDTNPGVFKIRFESRLFEEFRKNGYEIWIADDYVCRAGFNCLQRPDTPTKRFFFTYFEKNLLKMTPMYEVIHEINRSWLADDRRSADDVTAMIDGLPRDKPLLVYVHLLFPHPPYVFKNDCGIRPDFDPLAYREFAPENREEYVQQLNCLNSRILPMTEKLMTRFPDAIVVYASDHGSGFVYREKSTVPDFRFAEQDDPTARQWLHASMSERFATLMAVRAPDACRADAQLLNWTVDILPFLRSCLGGRAFEPRPAKSYSIDRDTGVITHVGTNGRWIRP